MSKAPTVREGKKKYTVLLPERTKERLDYLKDLTDAGTITEVLKNAVMVYEAVAKHLAEGDEFTVESRNGEVSRVHFNISVPVHYSKNGGDNIAA